MFLVWVLLVAVGRECLVFVCMLWTARKDVTFVLQEHPKIVQAEGGLSRGGGSNSRVLEHVTSGLNTTRVC
jgi:hypothetical protein